MWALFLALSHVKVTFPPVFHVTGSIKAQSASPMTSST
jgi:hypothetical protein